MSTYLTLLAAFMRWHLPCWTTASPLRGLLKRMLPLLNDNQQSAKSAGIAAALMVVATAHAGVSVSLAWNPSPDPSVTGYYLYYHLKGRTNISRINVGKSTKATIPNLQPGQTYAFYATAHNAAGLESLPSNEVYYTVPPLVTGEPSPLIAHKVLIKRMQDQPVTIPVSRILQNDSDPAGTPLALASVQTTSRNGQTVRWSGSSVYYLPRPGMNHPDTFSFTVTNRTGVSAHSTVIITALPKSLPGLNFHLTLLSPREMEIHSPGIPGMTYEIQATESIFKPRWSTLGRVTAGTNGFYRFVDGDAGQYQHRYYRIVLPNP